MVALVIKNLRFKKHVLISELGLMFSLLNRIPDGINPMLECLHEYIIQQGLADMINCANIITTVSSCCCCLFRFSIVCCQNYYLLCFCTFFCFGSHNRAFSSMALRNIVMLYFDYDVISLSEKLIF